MPVERPSSLKGHPNQEILSTGADTLMCTSEALAHRHSLESRQSLVKSWRHSPEGRHFIELASEVANWSGDMVVMGYEGSVVGSADWYDGCAVY